MAFVFVIIVCVSACFFVFENVGLCLCVCLVVFTFAGFCLCLFLCLFFMFMGFLVVSVFCFGCVSAGVVCARFGSLFLCLLVCVLCVCVLFFGFVSPGCFLMCCFVVSMFGGLLIVYALLFCVVFVGFICACVGLVFLCLLVCCLCICIFMLRAYFVFVRVLFCCFDACWVIGFVCLILYLCFWWFIF